MRSSDELGSLLVPEGWAGFRRGEYLVVSGVLAVAAVGGCVVVGRALRLGDAALVIGGLAAVLLCVGLVRFGLRSRADGRRRDGLTAAHGETVVTFRSGHVGTIRVVFGATCVVAFVLAGQLLFVPFNAWPAVAALVAAGVLCWWLACVSAFPVRGGHGVGLSAAGVRVPGHERRRVLGWDEIGSIVPHVRYGCQLSSRWLLLRERRDPFHPAARVGQARLRWLTGTEWTDSGIEVACEDLDVDPVVLFHLVRCYAEHPVLRHELGTSASIDRVRLLASDA